MTDNERDELLKSLFFKTPDRHAKKDPKGNLYVTARYVMNVLDQKVGPANWSDTYRVIDVIHRPDGTARICVECSLTVCGVTKHDVGYGELEITEKTNRKTGEVYEVEFGNYEKEAYSIALKRAAVKFGIARDLYQDGMPRFDVEPEQPDSIPGEDEAPPEAPEAAKTPHERVAERRKVETPPQDGPVPENGKQGAPDIPPVEDIADLLDKHMSELEGTDITRVIQYSRANSDVTHFAHWQNRLKAYYPEAQGGDVREVNATVREFVEGMAHKRVEEQTA